VIHEQLQILFRRVTQEFSESNSDIIKISGTGVVKVDSLAWATNMFSECQGLSVVLYEPLPQTTTRIWAATLLHLLLVITVVQSLFQFEW
jgi:hypothetical protein